MIIQSHEGGVATVRMNDPERRNAFSMAMRIALLNTFRALEADQSVRAIVFTGGDKTFCVGGDVTAMGHQPMGAALDRMRIVHDLVRLIAQSSKPYIAAVEGWAVGGGLSLSLLCDTVVASDTARFKAGFGEIGMAPDTGILYSLPARVGKGRAKQILLYNEPFSAQQALDWGVIDYVVPSGGAQKEADRLAHVLAAKAPLPIALTRSVFASGLDDVLLREREIQAMLFSSTDHDEGKSAFFEKRTPSFKGS
ncbi:enoyl-CoA hydratase/isomerase family protein [Caenimonas sp. SL110]|uniref:enoyl-CoA hydratase/isomerase family protein n=1 Tax=Caenimonas sp. SL110 TaxID=1450524 RepID=UPI0006536783|nr:enoyl-CoA hydratase-related protein [Caenimonas sp. SL110]